MDVIDASATFTGSRDRSLVAPMEAGGVAEYLLANGADDAVALVSRNERVTYAQLRRRSEALAGVLRERRLPTGTPVALIATNGPFWVAAYIAILRCGLVVVPLPVGLAAGEALARIAFVRAPVVFVGAGQQSSVAGIDRDAVSIVPEQQTICVNATGEAHDSVRINATDDAAYLFTSGTTGTPRIVRITHGNIRANTESILGYLDLRRDDRALVVLPYSYVFGASLLHTHLRVGACLIDQHSTAFPESTVNMLERERCTVFAGVPSVFHALLRNSTFGGRSLPHLRVIQQAGGRLPLPLLRELVQAHPRAQVHVMYGQTEATARLSALDPDLLLEKLGSIGRGIPGVTLRVTDEKGCTVRAGEVGEIRARGANVSPGYLGDPELTAEKMPDGELRTGDLATVDADDYIYVVDRIEDFIKTSGFRIASQDIESVAMELVDLVAVAAVGVPDDARGERVELLAVPRPDSEIAPEDVLKHCRARLPRASVPASVRFATQLPLNANGKVVKRAVREILAALSEEGIDDGR